MSIYDLNRTGQVIVGPGEKYHTLSDNLETRLPEISFKQQDAVRRAEKYAKEQSIKMVLKKRTVAHQQQKNKLVVPQKVLLLMCGLMSRHSFFHQY
ncbi:poly(U)-binding-splicing factor half pint-like [Chelonus insularis]|uniref:poly(U)-binding-splicing factor half pint-like n=1 Tax=Chelonus insularis TaxID=460826 RepID=UPI00158D8206|nr:poly(U)-binding-splicing factor half pint-like [Chelonus insularis]